jgi:uncharacterized protein YdhG (YjbR/CyaY superfamily)
VKDSSIQAQESAGLVRRIFPTIAASSPTAAVIEAFKDELKGFSTSNGTIHFPLDKPTPGALIKRMVRARMGQSRN